MKHLNGITAVTLFVATIAMAQPAKKIPGLEKCEQESKSLCPGKQWGKGLLMCLMANDKFLSVPCREFMRPHPVDPNAPPKAGSPAADCEMDDQLLCGGKHSESCLKKHAKELRPECKRHL